MPFSKLISGNRGQDGPGRVGVVDIGSNTVRLVVYDAPTRLPVPMFNEKAQCELGRGLAETGRLNATGVQLALNSFSRFIKLARAMQVEELSLVATAAVRDAEDGMDFVAQVRNRFDLDVEVLSGQEEAELAALGLLSGLPEADGVLGDLGGGSLDLVDLDHGNFGQHATLPLGHLRLSEAAGGKTGKAANITASQLQEIDWLKKKIRGRPFYAVGGSWRCIAKILIEQTDYPLHVVDNFTIGTMEAMRLSRIVSGLSPSTLEKMPMVSKKRTETLPFAATVLRVILEQFGPSELIFSGFGMREGQLVRSLPETLSHQDPLISGCARLAERTGRFSIDGDEIFKWLSPVFTEELPRQRRIRMVACLLSDIGWPEHPDYRAEHAFHRVLRVPFAGLTHPQRVLLALAVFIRYNGDAASPIVKPLYRLLDEEQLHRTEAIGLGLRLAHTLSGSAPNLLSRTKLLVVNDDLVMVLPKPGAIFDSETVRRRFRTFARHLGLTASMMVEDRELYRDN